MKETKYTKWVRESFVPVLKRLTRYEPTVNVRDVREMIARALKDAEQDVIDCMGRYQKMYPLSGWDFLAFADRTLRALQCAERAGLIRLVNSKIVHYKIWTGDTDVRVLRNWIIL